MARLADILKASIAEMKAAETSPVSPRAVSVFVEEECEFEFEDMTDEDRVPEFA